MIFVECKPDLLLVQKITGISKKEILHSGNKGEVIKNLSRSKNSTGLIDEDPGDSQPKYIASMLLLKHDRHSDLKIYKDNKNNFLVVLCPVLEEWILKTAGLEKIKMTDYNLPGNASRFHKIINLNLRKFEMLLESLLTSKRIAALKSVLCPKNPAVS
jgi:hypothetical protein